MRRKAHVRFGGRSEETSRLKGRYRASLRSYFVKVRDNGRVVSQAIVIAIAVTANGEREVLGLDVGPSESGAFWLAFLRDLAARGRPRGALSPWGAELRNAILAGRIPTPSTASSTKSASRRPTQALREAS